VKFGRRSLCLFALALLIAACAAPRVSAQALYTATQLESLSVWAGATGTDVNLPDGGRNFGISAGVDLRVWQFHGILPSIEIRGTYPVDKGTIADEENAMVGLKIEHQFGRRFHPYGDFFFGRGAINYQGRGYISPDGFFLYQETYSNILSPGLGVDIDLTHHYAFKADAQLWHQKVPVTASGTLNSIALTVGAIYRFDFNQPFRKRRIPPPVNTSQ
jgi:hypothetical protein